MVVASTYFLGVTILLLVIFAIIVVRICHPKRRTQGERAKYRMMHDERDEGRPDAKRSRSKEDGDAR